MKRLSLVLAILLIGGNLGCKKDPCKKVDCKNGGTCVDGACRCNLPWEGNQCEIDARDKFVGAWKGTENCGQPADATTTIVKSTASPLRIVFDQYYYGVYAELTSSTNITIPSQQVTLGQTTITVSGNGVLNGNTLILNITYSSGGQGITCTSTLNRQ